MTEKVKYTENAHKKLLKIKELESEEIFNRVCKLCKENAEGGEANLDVVMEAWEKVSNKVIGIGQSWKFGPSSSTGRTSAWHAEGWRFGSARFHMYTYRVKSFEVVDGDTFKFEVDLGFGVSKKVTVRLLGVDTNEVYGVKKESEEYKKGIQQSRFAKEQLSEADEIVIRTYKDDEKEKYGRYLADVLVDEKSLADLLTENFDEIARPEVNVNRTRLV